MFDRVEHLQKLHGFVAVALFGEGESQPCRGVRVLAAVFAHAGQITFDVTGVLVGFVERGREQAKSSLCRAKPDRS